jgi:LysR family transcriptional regulator of abg operon
MKLHQLAALVAAAESGSLRQAAEKMRLSQPALSRSIHELEREIGAKLLDRTARGVEATVYGKALIMRSKIIDSEIRQPPSVCCPSFSPVSRKPGPNCASQ